MQTMEESAAEMGITEDDVQRQRSERSRNRMVLVNQVQEVIDRLTGELAIDPIGDLTAACDAYSLRLNYIANTLSVLEECEESDGDFQEVIKGLIEKKIPIISRDVENF